MYVPDNDELDWYLTEAFTIASRLVLEVESIEIVHYLTLYTIRPV